MLLKQLVVLFTLLTYLIGHSNPINGFRPAATHPSRCLYFLCTFAIWLHQSMTGVSRFSLSSGYKVVLFKYPSRRSILLHTNDMTEQAQPLNVNTLHNVYVVEELIQLTIESNAEIITNSKILRRNFLSNTIKATVSVLNSVHASAP